MTRAGPASAAMALLVSLALLAAACAGAEERAGNGSDAAGDGDTPQAPAESAPATTETQPAPPPTEPPPPPEPPATTRAPEEPAPPPAAEDPEPAPTVTEAAPPEPSPAGEPSGEEQVTPAVAGSLPGEPFEYGPEEGTSLAVVGVPYEEMLELQDVPFGETLASLDASNPYEGPLIVREAPSGEFLTSLESWTGAIVATGRTRRLPEAAWPDAVWDEVRVAGLTGWARAAHLAPIGLTGDATAHLIDVLGETPQAHTLMDLALIVGEAFASDEGPSRVTVVTRPIVFEGLGEVTVDVLNIGDDSLLGLRLHVLATPEAEDWMSEDPGPFTLWIAERTILCHSHRGVGDDGLCT